MTSVRPEPAVPTEASFRADIGDMIEFLEKQFDKLRRARPKEFITQTSMLDYVTSPAANSQWRQKHPSRPVYSRAHWDAVLQQSLWDDTKLHLRGRRATRQDLRYAKERMDAQLTEKGKGSRREALFISSSPLPKEAPLSSKSGVRGEAIREKRRTRDQPHDDHRSAFARDRDRVLFSSALRRLAGVTQVLSPGPGELFHNRLTHSLEVAQIARRLAEFLNRRDVSDKHVDIRGMLDPEVCEAAALLHDVGHPPFGHAGESALDRLMREYTAPVRIGTEDPDSGNALLFTPGFEGNAQSFRIATRLSPLMHDETGGCSNGLDLTAAVLDGLLKYPITDAEAHSARDQGVDESLPKKYGAYHDDSAPYEFARTSSATRRAGKRYIRSLEAEVMDLADDIAYSIHDLEDFFRAGMIPLRALYRDRRFLAEVLQAWLNDPEKKLRPDKALVALIEEAKKYCMAQDESLFAAKRGDARESLYWIMHLLGTFADDKDYNGSLAQRVRLHHAASIEIRLAIEEGPNVVLDSGVARLAVPDWLRLRIAFSKRLVWTFVLNAPILAEEQFGQRQIIRSLFLHYVEILDRHLCATDGGYAESESQMLIPPVFAGERHRMREMISPQIRRSSTTLKNSAGRYPYQITRLAADIVCSLTDAQAMQLYQRLTGHGSSAWRMHGEP